MHFSLNICQTVTSNGKSSEKPYCGKRDEKCSYSRLEVVAWFRVEFRLACVVCPDKSAGNAATNGDSGGIGGIPRGC
ncbi:Potassium voltage-gated channel subfamily C member [Trichinella spiralis]|uniref:Potassium voltage-gated channel subfamily C member n=1 Tax=Trichinella spiralis TaxID=6334 RepID=A0ABR3KA22_TRISP